MLRCLLALIAFIGVTMPASAAPPPDKAAMVEAISAQLAGDWRSTTWSNYAGAVYEHRLDYSFLADGTYTGTMTVALVTSSDLVPTSTALSGTWRVAPISLEKFVLELDEEGGVPFDEVTLVIKSPTLMVTEDGAARYERQAKSAEGCSGGSSTCLDSGLNSGLNSDRLSGDRR